MLTQRWRKIQESVNKFCGCLANINARNESGKTEQTKIGDAKELYKTKYGSGFKLDHAWLLLRYQPKWVEMQENASTKTSAKKSKPSAGCSSSTPITPINIDQEDLNNNVQDQTVRPPGRKGEKRKSKQDNTEASTPVADLYQKIMDDKRQRDEQKMELLRQKIEQNERKEQLKRAELEMKIMSVDTSDMDDEQRLYYSLKRMKILTGGLKARNFAAAQESARKDVERAFGVLQARFAIVRGPARFWDRETLQDIMKACIIMHNMIIEDERGKSLPLTYDVREGENNSFEVSHDHTAEFQDFIRNHLRIRDRETYTRLREDLVEHLWRFRGGN